MHDDLILEASLSFQVPSPERNALDDDNILFSALLWSWPCKVIRVDKMNISCCCLGKCLLGPCVKLWSLSRADGMGQAPPPAPQVRRSGLQKAPGHLTLGRLGTRLQVGRRNRPTPCSAILCAHWKGDLWWQSGGRDSLSSKGKLWEASALVPDLTRI